MFIRRETLVAAFDIRVFLVPWKPRGGDHLASTWNQDLRIYAMFIAKDANTVSCVVIFITHRVSVFNTIFNNISAISWRSVLLVEKNRVPGENHRPVASHWQTLSHSYIEYTSPERIRTHNVSGDRHWLHW
jgi:hypothetical protein